MVGTTNSQNFKYPVNMKYRYGFMPANLKNNRLDVWYKNYKNTSTLLIACNGGTRTGAENDDETKVESMGWAMIIAAYMCDKTTYDGLLKYYESKVQGHGMMAWRTTCSGVTDAGSASDGDLDVAYSLVVASWQWGTTYKDKATKLITTCKKLITSCNGTSVLFGGISGNTGYGGCQETDISYYTPAFFRVFADFTKDQAWTKLADDTYTVLNNAANKTTGLVPDWHTFAGGQSSKKYAYAFDACRVPWRIALDYLWNGNEKAKAWCKTVSDWAYKTGPSNIKDGYNLDGTATGTNHNMSFVGGFAVAAMCNSQDIANAFGTEVAKISFDSYWYHAFLGCCYMLTLTGNMWQIKDTSLITNTKLFNNTISKNSTITAKTLKNHQIELSGVSKGNSVSLMTLQGDLVKQSVVPANGKLLLNVSSVTSGCYLVDIRNGKTTIRKGLVVSIY
jgi:endo-1,4-beta-D-glucanase Y